MSPCNPVCNIAMYHVNSHNMYILSRGCLPDYHSLIINMFRNFVEGQTHISVESLKHNSVDFYVLSALTRTSLP